MVIKTADVPVAEGSFVGIALEPMRLKGVRMTTHSKRNEYAKGQVQLEEKRGERLENIVLACVFIFVIVFIAMGN